MANQIVVSAGAKVRNLQDVIIGTSGVLTSLGFDVANGVPKLDVNGKILVSQLPNSVMEYKGTWNAATNTPTLANGTGNQGDVYLCNVAGTVDFGAGPIAFIVGDQVIYSGSIWQRASGATGTVTSVAITESGDSLNITGSPITTSGTINIGFNGTNLQYVNGAGNLTTFPDLTGFVPYTGATANVNIGTHSFIANNGTYNSEMSPSLFGVENAAGTIFGVLEYNKLTLTNSTGAGSVMEVNAQGLIFPDASVQISSYTDAKARLALSLTTTGTSGVATYNNTTGVFNIPNYGSALSGYVPYTGATQDVDLGAFKLNAQSLHIKGTAGNGHLGLKHQSASATASANEVSLFADSLGDLSWLNGNLYLSKFITSANTANRYYTFPNLTGIMAMLEATQTFTATNTFTNATKNNGGILLQNASSSSLAGYMNLGGLTNGVKFTSGGGVSNSFTLPSATGYTFTFPNATGTIALTSDLTGYVTSVTGTSPIVSSGGTTPAISIPAATSSVNGYLSATDWNIFNGKIGGGGTTNYIPKFSGTFSIADSIIYDNSGKVLINTTDSSIGHRLAVYSATEAAQLRVMGLAPSILFTESTTNTNTYSAYLGVVTSTNNFYTGSFVGDFVMSNNSNYGIAFAVNNSQKLRIANTGAATFASSVTATSFVKTSGTSSQFLKADGSVDSTAYGTGSVTSVGLSSATSGVTIGSTPVTTSGTITIAIATATTSQNGLLSSADWTTFNNKQGAITLTTTGTSGAATFTSNTLNIPQYQGVLTNPVTGTGTTNYLPKFTGASTIGNSNLINDASGNLGLGVTPSAWGASSFAFQTQGGAVWSFSSAYMDVWQNSYYNGTSSIYTTTAAASFYRQSAGRHEWNIAPSGTAGNAITWTQAMTLFSTGNLAVGTTDDTSNTKLVLYSTSAATQIKAAGTAPAITFSNTITSPTIGGSLGACTSANQFITGTAAGDMIFVNQFTGSLILGTNSAARLTISNAGAATFSSSVTANSLLTINEVYGGEFIRLQRSGVPTQYASLRYGIGGAYGLVFDAIDASASDPSFIWRTSANGSSFTERMRITSGGNVLIGTTTTYDKLTINGGIRSIGSSAGFFFEDRSNSSYFYGWYSTGNTNVYFFNGNSGSNIASINPSTGVYTPLSDINKKKDFEQSDLGLNAILGLKPTLYRMKDEDNTDKHLGFIAQEVKEFIPQAYIQTKGEKDDFIGLDYQAITATLVKAIQELKAEIDTLKIK